MPWFISEQTFEAFNIPARYVLARMLADDFEAIFPKAARALKRNRIINFTSTIVERNEALGLSSKDDVIQLMKYTARLGIDFENDPQYEKIANCLNSDGLPEQKLVNVTKVVNELSASIWGKYGKPYYMSLKRYLSLSYTQLYTINYIREVVACLKHIYPEKAEYVGDDALGTIALLGVEKAKEWNLAPRPGNVLCAGILFFFGCGCDHDPLWPWIADYLKREMSPDLRTRRIFGASRRMALFSLKTRNLDPEQEDALTTYALVKPLESLNAAAFPQWPPNTSLEEALSTIHPEREDGEEDEWAKNLANYISEEEADILPLSIQVLLALGYMASDSGSVEFDPDIDAILTHCINGQPNEAVQILEKQIHELSHEITEILYNEHGGDIL